MGGYFAVKAHDSKDELPDVIDKVNKLIQLPIGEEPTLATVSDMNKLRDQVFFTNAENGDKVLIYNKARKAYLYRPSQNRLIDVTTVSIGEQAHTAGAQTDATQSTASVLTSPGPVTIAIYNGTKTPRLASKVETQFKTAYPGATVTTRENAQDQYDITRVIDITGNHDTAVKQLVGLIGGDVGVLPTRENKPSTDILIIIGNDFVNKL